MPRARKAAAMPQGVCTCKEPKKFALALGSFAALAHLVWSIIVASGFAQSLVNWVMVLHMMNMVVTVGTFNLVTAAELVIVTFIVGYAVGYVFALVWNKTGKCKCCM